MQPPECDLCKDKGFLVLDVEYRHPMFGKLIPCPKCKGQAEIESRLRISGLSEEMRGLRFATSSEEHPEAMRRAESLAADPRWFYTLHGKPGRGKTHLLACLVNEGIAHGYPSIYTTTAELLDHLRSTFRPGAGVDFDSLWERVVSARILALDELDRVNATAWSTEKFFELVEQRYREGSNRLTAFATNASIDELPEYLRSRIRDKRCAVFEIKGVDMRQVRD